MTYQIDKKRLLLLLTLCLTTPHIQADNETSSHIFKYQQTMANKGQATAQYQLGMMHETGDGTALDLQQAKIWYQLASNQQYKPAQHRLKFLDLNAGKAADPEWIDALQQDANTGDGEALLLLGQMYAAGNGVAPSLSRAASLLRKASAKNTPGSEAELLRVEDVIEQQEAELQSEQQLVVQETQPRSPLMTVEAARLPHLKTMTVAQPPLQPQLNMPSKSIVHSAPAAPTPTLATRGQEQPRTPIKIIIEEIDISPCSGRNRFATTCR